MTSEDIELLGVLVKIDGKAYPVLISDENKDIYLRTIANYEGGVKIVDKPLDNLRLETGEYVNVQ